MNILGFIKFREFVDKLGDFESKDYGLTADNSMLSHIYCGNGGREHVQRLKSCKLSEANTVHS
jgi:hypothetical protein